MRKDHLNSLPSSVVLYPRRQRSSGQCRTHVLLCNRSISSLDWSGILQISPSTWRPLFKGYNKKCFRYGVMRLHYSAGCRVCFNLYEVTIGGCSISENGQKMENDSAKALLWVPWCISWEVKEKASVSAFCNRLGSFRDCKDVTLLSMYVSWTWFAVSVTHTT